MKAAGVRWLSRPSGPPIGLAFARESGHVLLALADGWLILRDRRGRDQARSRWPVPPIAVAAADDGKCFALADSGGTVAALAPDLRPIWRERFESPPTALAVSPNGGYLFAAGANGRVSGFAPDGGPAGTLTSARPVRSLAVVPELPRLAVAADFGLVATADFARPAWLWTDAPVVHCGGVSVTGDGSWTVVPCYSGGVRRYTGDGRVVTPLATPETCRHAVVNYTGTVYLVTGLERSMYLIGSDGDVRFGHDFARPIEATALTALEMRPSSPSPTARSPGWISPTLGISEKNSCNSAHNRVYLGGIAGRSSRRPRCGLLPSVTFGLTRNPPMKFALGAMSVGDILDRGLKILMSRFATFFAINFLFSLPLLAWQLVLPFLSIKNPVLLPVVNLAAIFLGSVLGIIVSAATIIIIAREYIDEPVGMGDAISLGLKRFGPLFTTSLVVGLVIILGYILLIIPGIIFSLMYAVVAQVVVLEDLSVDAAMRRSAELTKNYRWRIFGIQFLVFLIIFLFGFALGIVLAIAFPEQPSVVGPNGFSVPAPVEPLAHVVKTCTTFLVQVVAGAYQAVCVTLVYLDLRVRKEGFDLEVAAQKVTA